VEAEEVEEKLEEEEVRKQVYVRYALTLLLEIDARSDVAKDSLSFQGCDDDLLFWRECFKLKQLVAAGAAGRPVTVHMEYIWNHFLKSGGKYAIPLSHGKRKELKESMFDSHSFLSSVMELTKGVEKRLAYGPFPQLASSIQEVIGSSWKEALTKLSLNEFGKILFMNWFALCPDVIPLFQKDMSRHGTMLVTMLETAVTLLTDLKELVPRLVSLGNRHVTYGSRPEHFEALGQALVQTMFEALDREDATIGKAWNIVFQMMSSVMIHAMQRAAAGETNSEHGTGSTKSSKRKINRLGLGMLLEMEHIDSKLKGKLVFYFPAKYINFWRAVYDLEESKNPDEAAKIAVDVFNKYCSKKAADSDLIRLPAEIHKDLENLVTMKKFVPGMFEKAILHVEAEMDKRPFPRFVSEMGRNIQVPWDELNEKLSPQQIGKILFMNFFMKKPEVMPMFRDVEKHGAMIASVVDLAIGSVGDLKPLIPNLVSLGLRHKRFKDIKPDHFDGLREALIMTFSDFLKENFTPEMADAWRVIYNFMAALIQYGINQEDPDDGSDAHSQSSDHSGKEKRASRGGSPSIASSDLGSDTSERKRRDNCTVM